MTGPALRAALLSVALAALPSVALAESPLYGSFEFRGGNYRPSIDNDITSSPKPFATAFGSGRPTEFTLHLARALPWRAAGTLEVGASAGFWSMHGHGTFTGGHTPSPDPTVLSIIPTQLTLTYRLDMLYDRLSIPVIPYARVSLDRYNWWITGSSGSTTKSGATNGYAYGGGLAFVLDILDPTLARELDLDSGINHTMIVVDVAKTRVTDFGAKSSWNLSDTQLHYSFGLLFVF
jgi:hypothetical protein